MIPPNLLPFLTLLPLLSHPTTACTPPLSPRSPFPLTLGTDPPSPPATLGYTLNHLSLTVSNITATRHFYGDVLGMRHIFTYSASPAYSITYLGYPHGGRNGTGYQTGAELWAELKNSEGLIEFLHYGDRTTPLPAAMGVANTFSHVGLVVPDVRAAEERMRGMGVRVLKGVGEELDVDSGVVRAYGLDRMGAVEAAAGIRALGFGGFLLVADPDGNVVEVQEQV